MTELAVQRGEADRILELEPLWRALQDHHAELDGVPPVRDRDESWRRRRAQYERWMGEGSGRLFIAERDGRAVGYLMLRVGNAAATWAVDDRVGEVETLAVLEGERSSGVGGALMDNAIAAVEAEGVRALGVGVVHTNVDAIRFYERAGFQPFYVQMLRLPR